MGLSSPLIGTTQLAFEQFEIVCLEHNLVKLYAEVVQIVETTQICWVRPLVMLMHPTHDSSLSIEDESKPLYDLRQGSDLLLPVKLFRPALDTEVIPLLELLNCSTASNATNSTHHSKLSQFIKQVCLSHPEVFQSDAVE